MALALLVAPAGYGKTTTLLEWAQYDERPFARIDRMNLILHLNSDRLLALTAGAAVTRKGYACGEGRGAVGSPGLREIISPVAPPASPLRPRSCRDALRYE